MKPSLIEFKFEPVDFNPYTPADGRGPRYRWAEKPEHWFEVEIRLVMDRGALENFTDWARREMGIKLDLIK